MAFKIELAAAAERDIADAVDYIAQDSPAMAQKWFATLFAVIETLRELPLRHSLIPEAEELKRELRSIQHYSHRVVYEVCSAQNTVYIVRVYHGSRLSLTEMDL